MSKHFLLCAGMLLMMSIGAYANHDRDTATRQPAPAFQLKDLKGKTVSLSDFKGKVVILDFWATWCVPCRESFPAMQKTIDKYKNDPGVQFLFIDTREKIEDKVTAINQFLEKEKYTFKVLLDETGPDGKQSKYFHLYDMPGIPTKYVIDGKGNIRFKSVGFNPGKTEDQVVDELSEMIETAKKAG